MIREDAISSWARVILAVDWTLLIRRRTARSCAPMLAYTALLGVAGLTAGLGPDSPVGRRRRRALLDRLRFDLVLCDRRRVLFGDQQLAVALLEARPELVNSVLQRDDRVVG